MNYKCILVSGWLTGSAGQLAGWIADELINQQNR